MQNAERRTMNEEKNLRFLNSAFCVLRAAFK